MSAYVVETWPSRIRGRAAALVISVFTTGGALAAVISAQLLPDWRLMFLIAGAAVVLPVGIVLVLFPESAGGGQCRACLLRLGARRPEWSVAPHDPAGHAHGGAGPDRVLGCDDLVADLPHHRARPANRVRRGVHDDPQSWNVPGIQRIPIDRGPDRPPPDDHPHPPRGGDHHARLRPDHEPDRSAVVRSAVRLP